MMDKKIQSFLDKNALDRDDIRFDQKLQYEMDFQDFAVQFDYSLN